MGSFLFIPAIFCICCLAAQWATFDCYPENSLTHPILITVFGLSIFGPKVTKSGWVSTPNWNPNGLWSQCHNPLSYSRQIAENTFPRIAPNFYKMWNAPNTQNSYSLTIVGTLLLFIGGFWKNHRSRFFFCKKGRVSTDYH